MRNMSISACDLYNYDYYTYDFKMRFCLLFFVFFCKSVEKFIVLYYHYKHRLIIMIGGTVF